MAYPNQAQRLQKYINAYPNTGRTYNAINFFNAVSAANTAIDMSRISFLRAEGKLRTLQINYWPLQCDVEGECGQGLCADGETVNPVNRTFDITQCTATKKWALNLNDLRSLDPNEWDAEFVARTIVNTAMPAARKLLAEDMIAYALTKVGVHTDGNAEKPLRIVNPITGAISATGWGKVLREYSDAGQDVPYALGDGQEVYDLGMLQGSAGTDQYGVNTRLGAVNNLWYAQGLLGNAKGGTETGNYVLAIDPRMFKLISYINNAGQFRTDLDQLSDMNKLFTGAQGHDFILGTVTDPVTGIIWDLYMNFEKCDLQWTFHLEHQWDMFVMPDINCNIAGYNGITLWKLCPEVEAPCQTGLSPVSPTYARTYTATPTLAEIPTISQSSIGGVTNNQVDPVPIATVADLVAFMNQNYQSDFFQVSGSNITYSGVVDLTVSFNDGDYVLNFS